jgi:hypothetical protein
MLKTENISIQIAVSQDLFCWRGYLGTDAFLNYGQNSTTVQERMILSKPYISLAVQILQILPL